MYNLLFEQFQYFVLYINIWILASQHSGTIDEKEDDEEDESEIHCYVCDQVCGDLDK